jgi:hypothetical protein
MYAFMAWPFGSAWAESYVQEAPKLILQTITARIAGVK